MPVIRASHPCWLIEFRIGWRAIDNLKTVARDDYDASPEGRIEPWARVERLFTSKCGRDRGAR